MSDDFLVEMLQLLDAPQYRYEELGRYYAAQQPLAFLAPEARQALGNRFGRIASNIPRLAVNSLAERLRVTGFDGVGIWPEWLANDLDQTSTALHREALLYGQSFGIVWADGNGSPRVSVESARQVATMVDPGSRDTIAAVKRWRTTTQTFAVKYLPDRIERFVANTAGAATAGFNLIDTIDNPLGVVPVVPFTNYELIYERADLIGAVYGRSEISDLLPLVDGLNKALADTLVTMEFLARPRRWSTGIELRERPKLDASGNPVIGDDGPVMVAENPFPESDRMMIAEPAEAKFGQLPGADLGAYEAAVRIFLGQIMAVSALPAHYIGVLTDNPSSADAIRSAEASLTARAQARQVVFGRAWERVAKLMVAVRDGVDPESVAASVEWADAGTRSIAQEADAAVKLYQAGLLSRAGTLKRLGFTEDEIQDELGNAYNETSEMSKAKSDPLVAGYLNSLS